MNQTKFWAVVGSVIALAIIYVGVKVSGQDSSDNFPNVTSVDLNEHASNTGERSATTERAKESKKSIGDPLELESNELLNENQQLLIDRISPETYKFRKGEMATHLRITGGNIGKIDAEEVKLKNDASIRTLLKNLGVLTGATEQLKIEILRTVKNGDRLQVEFRQLIDDAQVSRTNRIDYDGAGKVKRVSLLLIDPSSIDKRLRVLRNEAEAYARAAVRQKIVDQVGNSAVEVFTHPIPGVKAGVDTTSLIFNVTDFDSAPSGNWKVAVMAVPGGIFTINVDAMSAEVTEVSRSVNWETRVCGKETRISRHCGEDTDGGSLPDAQNQVFEEDALGNAFCVADDPQDCQKPIFRNPWDVIDRLEAMMGSLASDWCCGSVGFFDGIVDIIVDETNPNYIEYGPNYRSDGVIFESMEAMIQGFERQQ